MEQQEGMHGQISQRMPSSGTSKEGDGDFVSSALPQEISQQTRSSETIKEGEFWRSPPEHVGFAPFHPQQGQQRSLDSTQAQPSLSLSLEQPKVYGSRQSQSPFTLNSFDIRPPAHPVDVSPHVGGHAFDLEKQPFQHSEQPKIFNSNADPSNSSVGAFQTHQGMRPEGGDGVHQQTYQTHQSIESTGGVQQTFQTHQTYQSHQAMEGEGGYGAHIFPTHHADGSSDQAGDAMHLQLVPASEYPPHEQGVHHQQYYPLPSASHEVVFNDPQLFMMTLDNFLAALGTRLTVPKVEGVDLNLHAFYCEVTARGGLAQVIRFAQWKEILEAFGIPRPSFSAPYVLRKHYTSLLFHYEQVYFFRAEGPLLAPPVPLPAPSAVEPPEEIGSPYEAPSEMLSTLKKKKRKLDPMQVFGVDPAASIDTIVTGAIDGKADEGYFVTVVVGTEKLSGVLYHVDSDKHQFASIPSLLDGIGSHESTAGLEVQLYGKKKTEPIRKRNPDAPKRTRTGYNIYFKEQGAKLKQLYPGTKGLGKKVIEMWGKLPENEKALYNARGNQEREKIFSEHREKMKTQSQVVEPAIDGGSSEPPVGDHDHGGAYYVSHDYHVSLEPESDLQSGQTHLSEIDQVYQGYHANEPLLHPPESDVPVHHPFPEQAYEMQEDEGDYTQEPGSDEEEDDAELEENYEEDDETAYSAEKIYEGQQDVTEYPASDKDVSMSAGTYPAVPTNEALAQESRAHDDSVTSKQPYYGQEHAYMYGPTVPQQSVGSQRPVHMKPMGQLPYQAQDNGKPVYPHLQLRPAEAASGTTMSQQIFFAHDRYGYGSAKRGQEALGVPTSQDQAAFHRKDEAPAYLAPYHQNQGVGSGIQTRQVTPGQAYQDRYAYPMHMPHGQMYARPPYLMRFPHPPYPMPWNESQAVQYGHAYVPRIHQPQAAVPDVSGVVPASQAYQVQDGGHTYT